MVFRALILTMLTVIEYMYIERNMNEPVISSEANKFRLYYQTQFLFSRLKNGPVF